MIRPLAFFWALWRFIAKTWADRNRHDPRGQEVDCPTTDYARATVAPNSNQEVDCPITDYTKAIESNPNDIAAYLARGTAHLKAFAFDSAIADFVKAVEINPRSALAYCNLGWSYEAVGNEKKAIAHYRKALELDPSLEAARDNLKLLGALPERQPFHRQTKPKN